MMLEKSAIECTLHLFQILRNATLPDCRYLTASVTSCFTKSDKGHFCENFQPNHYLVNEENVQQISS